MFFFPSSFYFSLASFFPLLVRPPATFHLVLCRDALMLSRSTSGRVLILLAMRRQSDVFLLTDCA